jgi:hypothetical protein
MRPVEAAIRASRSILVGLNVCVRTLLPLIYVRLMSAIEKGASERLQL